MIKFIRFVIFFINMNAKSIGVVLIIVSILLASVTFFVKSQEDATINLLISERDSCYLDDGTCLHDDRNYTPYILGWSLSLALLIFGIYLLFDKSQEKLMEHQKEISDSLSKVAEKDEFSAFLKGFNPDEQNVLNAVHEQDGILQSTLRFRTGIGKAKLSLMLKDLEEKGHVSRRKSGKTNKVYLRF